MNEDIKKILNKFDKVLDNYELDKKFNQMSVDSICHLFPNELITIKKYIEAYENMRKEVISFIENNTYEYKNDKGLKDKALSINVTRFTNLLLNILNKVGDENDRKDKQLEAYENMRKEAIKKITIKQARIINEKDYKITDLDLDELLNILNKVGEDNENNN